ncbi:hypothetical protein SARC_03883 [Sphaeroforma arctica JP610]|uniref:Uncharacterized protein n=1 Tax=Sphaeroforma arctica JP610 TaxID=667725 RepID=A0A0L0G4B1_9EUKA|nr:hypothetical protein SARC_03883 [Sphaeroforma arctica JP610]KNC83895.1 hypothetical protein SARC_03883 [Sphaeroforma arctica JP610]|eukprot:XP_014157797.1 hypothetical protein SARC_03883 [Sphaeroforma arctica JP610]
MSQVTGEPYDSDGNTTDLSFAENDARASDAKHKSNSNGMTPVDTERELDRLQSDNKVPDVNFGSKVLETTSSSHRGQYTPLESKKNPAAVTTHTHFPSYADVNNDLSMSGFDEVTLSENSLLGVVDVVPGDPLSGFELGTSPQPYHLRKSINVDDGSEQRMNGGPETSHKLARANMDTDETDTEVSRNDIDHTGVEPFKVGPIYSDNDSSQVAERADGIVPDRLDVSDIASDHGMGLDTVGVSESESDEDAIESKDIIHNGTNSGTEGAGFNRVGVSDSESDSEAIRVNRVVAENQSDNVDEKVAGFNKAAHSSAERESDEQMIGFNRVAHSDVDNDADGEMTGFNRVAVQSESEDESTGAGFNRVGHSDSDSTDTEELSGFNRVATASDSDTDREGAGFERVAHSDSESADDGQQFGFNRVAFASDSEGGSVVAGYDRGTHSDAESDEEKAGFNRVAPESESESEGEVAGFNRAVHSDADSDSDPPAGFNRVAAMGDSESEAETSGFNRVAHSDTESGDDSAGFRRVGVSDSESDAESEGDANGFNRVGHSDTESDSDPPAGFNRVAAMSESESEAEMSGFNRVAHSDTGSDDDNDAGFRRVGVSDSESDTENNVHATGASSIARGDAGNGGKLPVGGRSFGVESVACGDTEGQTGCNLDGRSDTSNDTEPIETQRVIKIPLDTAATQDNLEKKSPRPPSRRFSRESMSVSVEDVLSYYTGSGSGSGSDRNEEDGVAIGALGEPVSNEGIPTSAKSLAGAAAVAGIAVLGGAAVLPCAAVGACDVTALSGAQDPEVEVARGVEEVDEMGDKPFQQSRDKGADSVPSIKPRTGAGVVEGDDRPVGKSRRVLPDAGRTKTASESSTDADVSSATGRKPKPRQRTPNRTGPTGTLSATTSNTDTDTTETNRTANGQPRQTTRPVPTQASASQLPHVPRPRHSVDTKYRADGLSSGANSMSSLASNTSVSSILRTGDSTCGVGTPLDDDQKKKVAFRSMSTGNDMTATIAALHPNKAGRPRGPSDGSVPVSVPMRRNSSQNTADDTAAASASVPQPTKATRPDISRGPAAMPGGVPVPVMRAHRSVDSGHSITLDESAPAVLPPKPTVAKRQSSQGSLPVAAMHSSNDDIATTPAKVVPKKITRPSVTESSAANTASNGDTADESVADAYPPRAKKSIGLSDGAVDPVEKPVIQDRVKKPVKTPVKEPLSYRSTEPAKQHQVAVTEAIKEPAPNATQESSNLFNPPTAARDASTGVLSTPQPPVVAQTGEHTAVTSSSQEHVPSPIARPDTHASRVTQPVHRRGSRPETISRSEEASSREVMEDSIGKGLPSKVPRPMRASTSAGTSSLRNVEAHIEAPEKTPCPTVSDSPVGRGSGMADGVGKDTSGAVVTKPTVARRQDKKDPTAQKFTKRRQRKGQNVNRKKSVLVDDDVGFDLTKEIAYQNDADDGGTYRTRTTNPFDSPAMHQNPDLIPEASCDILYRPPNTDINTDTNTNTHTNTNTNSSTNQSNAQKPKPKVRSNPFEESPAVGMDHGLIQDKHGYSDSTAGATTVLQAMRAAPGNYQRLEDSRPSHPTNNNNYNSNYNDNYNNNNFNGPLSSNSMNSMNSINSMNTMTSQPARPNNGSGLASGYIAGGATGVRNLPNVEIPSGYGNVGGKGYNTVMSPGSVGDRRSRDQFNADPSPRGQNVYESPRGVARNITPRDAYGAPSSQSPLNDYGRAMGRQQSYGNVEATANAKPQRAMGRQQSYGNVEATASAKPHPVPRNKAEYNSDLNDNLSAGGVAGSVFSPSPLSSEEDILDYQSVANGKKHSATLKRVLSHHSSGGLARQASQLGVGYDTVRQGTTTALSSGNSGPMSGPMSGRKVMSRSQDQLNVPGSRTPRGMEREQTHMVRSGSQGRLEHRHAPAVRRGSRGNAEATAPQYMMRSTDSLAKDTDVRKSFHSFYDRPGSSHFAPHETQDIRSPAQSRQRKQNPQRKNTDYANGDPYGVQSYLTQSMNNNNNNQRNASNTQYGEDIGNQYNTQNGRVQGQGQHRHPQQNQYQNPSGQPMRGQTAAPMQRSMDLDTATFNSGKKGKKASRRSLKSRSMYSVKSMDDVGGDYRSEKDKKCVIS